MERELAIDLAAELAPGIERVEELTPEIDQAEAVLDRGPAVAELERDQAEAVLAQDHPRGQPAVVARTKSVTAAHRRGLVPLLAAEDLAVAAAETSLEPAVVEAATAWEAADLAAVAAVAASMAVVAAEAEAEEAAAADGDEKGR